MTVVIVTLMGIVFRLAGVGGDSRANAKTVARMQRIENAISGYYAAYGSYPPVPLQGRSRDINVRVDSNGVQGSPSDQNPANLSSPDTETKKQVEAACRAQPLAVLWPMFMYAGESSKKSTAEKQVTAIATQLKASFGPLRNVGGLALDKSDWKDVQLFQFGLLSFLLPRYLFMLEGANEMYDNHPRGQWAKNNQRPCTLDQGRPYESWERMQKDVLKQDSVSSGRASIIENLASQSVCARWMPNFEGIISGGRRFYGVSTGDGDWPYLSGELYVGLPERGHRKVLRQFSPHGFDSSGSLYILNGMTISDGWGNEFYYYSEAPYQDYRLWSAGPNVATFPPWLDVNSFSTKEQKTILEWTKDDVSHLSN